MRVMLKAMSYEDHFGDSFKINLSLLGDFGLASGILLGLTTMTTNFSTISPFGIDDNTHTPPVNIDPPVFMLLIFISPFDINDKG
jgi:hypothetical protein